MTAKIVIAGGALAVAAVSRREPTPSAPASGLGPSGSELEGWAWPMPAWQGSAGGKVYEPLVSDGPGPRKRDDGKRGHNGADIDYKRRIGELPEFKVGTRQASSSGLFFCPDGVPILAARDGKIWSVEPSERGLQIVLDHGKPFATYYQHMSRVFFPLGREARGTPVKAGQVIGLVGNGSPSMTLGDGGIAAAKETGFSHLHFEIWKNGGSDRWVDPSPYLMGARVLKRGDYRIP